MPHMRRSIYALVVALSLALQAAPLILRPPPKNRSNQLVHSLGVQARSFNPLRPVTNGVPVYTELDRTFRQLLLKTRDTSLSWALRDLQALYRRNSREGKLQRPVPRRIPFPCPLNNTRSPTPPTSVERLRPGDIDIVAAIGDSLSAGNAIMSNSAFDVFNEFRGLVFSGGGLGNWRTTLTLPNILKVFNPQLYGFATGHSLVVDHRTSRLNIAEPMVMSHDLLYQARVLIDLLERDPHVDMRRHWKLLTVYVGNNDICSDMCHWTDEQRLLDQHARDLRQAFRLLRDHVPRLLINMVAVPNILRTMSQLKHVPFQCFMVHRVACNCLFNDRLTAAEKAQRHNTIGRWQQVDLDVAKLPEFHRPDFAIIGHPMIVNISTPLLPNGNTDWRAFAHDCFHFSQRTHASIANMLWNSMWLPDGQKPHPDHLPEIFEHFICPSQEQPFFVVRPG